MEKETGFNVVKDAGQAILSGVADLQIELLRNPVLSQLPSQVRGTMMTSLMRITHVAGSLIKSGNQETIIEGYRLDAMDGMESVAMMFDGHRWPGTKSVISGDISDTEMFEMAVAAKAMASRIEQYLQAKVACHDE